ncbi:4'-phosphopantetheinyl transferase family protein [Subtercola vilae]|uniref:4'-phosphopantetheinyl transferase superfamily protein n=1 Tax=Subtercola vilae TaxID=2056433 RepID=A0A4T2BXI2_9MICO|nr:4'-phosphopantetheinyl transferase family protein [Subtercola vilae]TIH34348.1 4'-phosphopantetheinyl transferase superfamily protein [Subtercola vilae]
MNRAVTSSLVAVYVADMRDLAGAQGGSRDGLGTSRFEGLLSDGERERAGLLVDAADRSRFVAAHALLRLATSAELELPLGRFSFDFTCARCGGAHGRPRLIVGGEALPVTGGYTVSLSTSHDLVAVAVAVAAGAVATPPAAGEAGADAGTAREVGVDVQLVSATEFGGFDEVALTENEVAGIRSRDDAEMQRMRGVLWARKEAVVKALGRGLRVDPATIDVSVTGTVSGTGSGIVNCEGLAVRWADVPLTVVGGAARYASAVALMGSGDVEVVVKNGSDLLRRY